MDLSDRQGQERQSSDPAPIAPMPSKVIWPGRRGPVSHGPSTVQWFVKAWPAGISLELFLLGMPLPLRLRRQTTTMLSIVMLRSPLMPAPPSHYWARIPANKPVEDYASSNCRGLGSTVRCSRELDSQRPETRLPARMVYILNRRHQQGPGMLQQHAFLPAAHRLHYLE